MSTLSFMDVIVMFEIYRLENKFQGSECGGSYNLDLIRFTNSTAFSDSKRTHNSMSCCVGQVKVSFIVWYQRLSHPCSAILSSLSQLGVVTTSPAGTSSVSCSAGKSYKRPFAQSSTVYNEPLELIEIDLWGPSPLLSTAHTYYIDIVDIFTKYLLIYFLQNKSNAIRIITEFRSNAKWQLGYLLKVVQSDGASEFKSLAPDLVQHGINQRVTCTYVL